VRHPIVVVGGSIAGLSAARALRSAGEDGTIQVIDRETAAPYRRPAVSKGILAGSQQPQDVTIPWPAGLDLERLPGLRATRLDLDRHRLSVADVDGSGQELPFSRVLIATGSVPRRLALPGPAHDVLTLRSTGDAVAGRDRLRGARSVVIIGAGFIGLEAASVARTLGKQVTVVETAELPLAHAVGETLGRHIAQIHQDRGVRLICGAGVRELLGTGTAEGIRLETGDVLEADLVIAAVGCAPAVGWLRSSGLDASAGLACGRTCTAVGTGIVAAAGDAASWVNPLYERRMRVEHWSHAIDQGTYAGRRLAGVADPAGFSTAPYFWSDQYDLKIQSVGSAVGHDEVRVIRREGESIVVAYGRRGVLIAVAGVNTGPLLPHYRPFIERQEPLQLVVPAEARLAAHG
jgi:NADPH-dependent 2,4-dienoyl-CoA reductase/sulfur reductase-like enzyme